MEKINLKPTVLVYETINGHVVIRFNSELIDFDDVDGSVSFYISLLNGRMDEITIKKILLDTYPQKKDGDVDEFFSVFKDIGLIEFEREGSDVLSEYDLERWSRNFEFFNSIISFGGDKYSYQNMISQARICLLGCGGLGSHLLYELAALGFKDVVIVDFDKVDISNLNRQILYKESDIGLSKSKVAKERILEFSPTMKISAIDLKISSVTEIENVVKDCDLVICVADKPRNYIIKWLNEACCKLSLPYINGGLDLRRAVFYSVIPGQTGCTQCWKSSLPQGGVQAHIIDADYQKNIDYSQPAPALSPLVSVAAGVMACEALKIITGLQPPALVNNLKSFSFDDLSIEVREIWQRNEDCSCCGKIR